MSNFTEAKSEWMEKPKSITLTNGQWLRLEMTIESAIQHSDGEREAWEKFSQEKNPDGSPRFPHAENNAKYFAERKTDLEEILKAIKAI